MGGTRYAATALAALLLPASAGAAPADFVGCYAAGKPNLPADARVVREGANYAIYYYMRKDASGAIQRSDSYRLTPVPDDMFARIVKEIRKAGFSVRVVEALDADDEDVSIISRVDPPVRSPWDSSRTPTSFVVSITLGPTFAIFRVRCPD